MDPQSNTAEQPRKPARRTLRVAAIAAIVALTGVVYILMPSSSEVTDNAYVDADSTSVAPKVRGLVAEVLVQDNQVVRAGDPLVRIDPEEFDARVLTAKAEVADAEAGVESAKAALTSLAAEERLADANVRAAESAIRSAKERSLQAASDQRRYENLVHTGAVAVQEMEIFRTAAVTAEQDLARVQALLQVSLDAAAVTRAKRATLQAQLSKAEAALQRAHASLKLALQDQGHAVIYAPIDGVVGNKRVQRGDYVQPGSRVLTLVPLNQYYVTANFKETQIGRMRAGQPVRVEIDALPGVRLKGTLESLAPGSGSRFALLPFEPGTGNFTKIVQRVPVRVRFDPGQDDLHRLRPGLSATVKVLLKDPPSPTVAAVFQPPSE